MRSAHAAALILGCLAAAGCGGTVEQGPRYSVWASPVDGTTGIGDVSVGLMIGAGPPLDPAALEAIRAGASLTTWPDLTPVSPPAITTMGATDPYGTTMFALTPSAPLVDGWYAALFGGLPARTIWPEASSVHAMADGRRGVRLHVGSAPAFWGFDACDKKTTILVSVLFSEPVVDGGQPLVTVSAGGRPCSRGGSGSGSTSLFPVDFSCDGAAPADQLSVSVKEGLASATGVAVAPVERAATTASLPLAASGCARFKDAP